MFIAALAGGMFGLLHGLLTVPLGLSQHVVGIGITLLATSLAYFTYRVLLPQASSPPRIEPFQPVAVPVLSDLPFIGPVLAQQTALTWLALALVPAVGVHHEDVVLRGLHVLVDVLVARVGNPTSIRRPGGIGRGHVVGQLLRIGAVGR